MKLKQGNFGHSQIMLYVWLSLKLDNLIEISITNNKNRKTYLPNHQKGTVTVVKPNTVEKNACIFEMMTPH